MSSATTSINASLEKFRAVCDDTNRLVDPTQISAALADVDNAYRNLNIARTLLPSLQSRDPLLQNAPEPSAESTAEVVMP
jgi:hypothetical protein